MDGYRGNSAFDAPEQTWWEKNRWPLVAGLVLGVVLLVSEPYGFGGLVEWTLVFGCGTGMAVAAFWERRSRPWFAPAVGLLVICHVAALSLRHWDMIPSRTTGTYIALKGATGADFAVSGLFLWVLHNLFDPKVGIRAHWSRTAKAVTATFLLFFLGVVAGTSLLILNAHDQKLASARVVFSRTTPASMNDVLKCMDPDAVANDQWRAVSGRYPARRLFSQFWGRVYRVVDTGSARVLQVETPQGRPLRPEERLLVERCSAPSVPALNERSGTD